ncbi:hypothetical protein, partial [Bartonella sp. CL74QHWL]|uniref:hypothetical protein n=1 Tax=Bartonella sp. CL74QHWL TaxID=3243541 RepID=UPI0035D137CC
FQKDLAYPQQRSTLKDTYGSEIELFFGSISHEIVFKRIRKNSKVVKFADDFENRDAFKLTERHRTERFKDFVIKTH